MTQPILVSQWLRPWLSLFDTPSQQWITENGTSHTVVDLHSDNRSINLSGTVFVSRLSANGSDKREAYIHQAITAGASLIITESPLQATTRIDVPVLILPTLHKSIGLLAADFFAISQPAPTMRAIAVTGTNGKTTIARLLAEMLTACGHSTAVMGTTGNGILPHLTPSSHTTLDAIALQRQLSIYARQGAKFVVLEASSHGLEQGRLNGTPIELGIFTNLSRDHLDYHGDMDSYFAAKLELFNQQTFPLMHTCIVNIDDAYGALLPQRIAKLNPNSGITTLSYSASGKTSDYSATAVEFSLSGTSISLNTPQGLLLLRSPLLGAFNVANIIAVIAAASNLGCPTEQIVVSSSSLQGASGRMQVIPSNKALFIVDYAHTPDAVTQVLSALQHHVQGQLWCILGCGGDRDKGKRPLMTQAAVTHADNTIITADNPRSESVEAILQDMLTGVEKPKSATLLQIPDRKAAIEYAITHADAGDIVVVAGKGHEDYQEIQGVRHHFSDSEVILNAL